MTVSQVLFRVPGFGLFIFFVFCLPFCFAYSFNKTVTLPLHTLTCLFPTCPGITVSCHTRKISSQMSWHQITPSLCTLVRRTRDLHSSMSHDTNVKCMWGTQSTTKARAAASARSAFQQRGWHLRTPITSPWLISMHRGVPLWWTAHFCWHPALAVWSREPSSN